jgi:predicted metal-dependent HD superfamily phosphohydrolase
MKHDNMLLNRASQWVRKCFQYIHCKHCIFHNYNHTKETVAAGKEIAVGMQVSDDELETVLLACWFHDVGMLYSSDNHEERSAGKAEEFLKKHAVGKGKIKDVKACILATGMPQKPAVLLEKIVCDADIAHLGKANYFEKNALLRQEFELNQNRPYSDVEWWLLNKEFFQEHQYFTPYARQRYNSQKNLNLITIINLLKKSTIQ